jgi:cytochrome P450
LDPERFSPPRAEDEKHTHCWVPFGGGAHLCIGYRFAEVQVKSIMHQMLLGLRWRERAEDKGFHHPSTSSG